MLIHPVFVNWVHLQHSEFVRDTWSPLTEVKVEGLETEGWGSKKRKCKRGNVGNRMNRKEVK